MWAGELIFRLSDLIMKDKYVDEQVSLVSYK